MGYRDCFYRLSDIIGLDDAFVGGEKPGKRDQGAKGIVSVFIIL